MRYMNRYSYIKKCKRNKYKLFSFEHVLRDNKLKVIFNVKYSKK